MSFVTALFAIVLAFAASGVVAALIKQFYDVGRIFVFRNRALHVVRRRTQHFFGITAKTRWTCSIIRLIRSWGLCSRPAILTWSGERRLSETVK